MNYKKELEKTLRSMTGTHSIRVVFFDFVEVSAYALSNNFDLEQFDKREEQYMKIISKYPRDIGEKFGECLALLVLALDRDIADILGELYMNLEIHDKGWGQFFTPTGVSRLAAELVFDKKSMDKAIAEKGYVSLIEPCVGGGAHVIAFAEVMRKHGYNYQTQLKVYCNDIDSKVLMLCYVQLSILGIDAICVNENALTLEKKEIWFTPFYMLNRMKEQSINENITAVEKTKEVRKVISENTDPSMIEQLSLF